jgi:hypothetical protein
MFFDPSRGPAVGDIQGPRNVDFSNADTAGLVVPQSLLVGGTQLTISLLLRNGVFDLYIDRLEISYQGVQPPIPEPST